MKKWLSMTKQKAALNSLINAWQNSTSVFIYITLQRSIDITADC